MLNLYYGSGREDKEKFIFDNIKGKAILIVPDQFSLQAERDAFFYLNTKGLMDLRIVDFSGLGSKVLSQVGGRRPPLIDRYGRHMLIARIIAEKNKGDELTVYKGLSWRNTFIDMMSRLISEMKRYENHPESIEAVTESMEDQGFLKQKLTDICRIYREYQRSIEGKYMDSEDYISFYGTKIMNAPMIKEADIWIYGFDSFDPINLSVIECLLKTAPSVNIVMTMRENTPELDFAQRVVNRLKKLGEDCGREVTLTKISQEYGRWRENVWDRQKRGEKAITLAQLSTPHAEAERAAAYILHLIRDEGYRYADMAVICNDMEDRGNTLRRILLRWNIPVFMDQRRKVLHHSAVSFLIAVMEVISKGYNNPPLMRILKSGIMEGSFELTEAMENYVVQYRIRGTAWRKPFTRGGEQYAPELLAELEELRGQLVDTIENARKMMGSRNTVESKVKGIYRFLDESFGMEGRIQDIIQRQEDEGFWESATETAQSWNVICNILDQLVETLGEEHISNEQLTLLMKAGFESVEIGLVPTSSDSILIGSLSRAMVSRRKAIIIMGANQGILPRESMTQGLLSEYEKELLQTCDLRLSKSQNAQICEDRLALYRSLYVADRHIYISCSRRGPAGEDLVPNQLFQLVRRLPNIPVLDDLEKEACVLDRLTTKEGSLGHMAYALREAGQNHRVDEDWFALRDWYEKNEPEMLGRIERGMNFNNRLEALGESFADALYRGDRENLEVSASRLEKYSGCPFAHFMDYGLRPEEKRVFEVGSREIGDVYHRCLMMLSRKLTKGDTAVTDENSPWMTISRRECYDEIRDILDKSFQDYREGVLFSGPAENYRRQRILDICDKAAWQMICQVRNGKIKDMYFEEPFGTGCKLPPVEVEIGNRRKVLIRGIIDRMDVLESHGVRIIDYKTGNNTINKEYFEEGYRLQLMVYMDAATVSYGINEENNLKLKPAGVFYFKIKDLDTDVGNRPMAESDRDIDDDLDVELAQRLEKAYRLEGIVVNDEDNLAAMDRFMKSKSGVLPVKRDKDGVLKSAAGGTVLSAEEFNELRECVKMQMERICREITDGRIDVSPVKEKTGGLKGPVTSCTYCTYRSVCLFDTSFEGCRYRDA